MKKLLSALALATLVAACRSTSDVSDTSAAPKEESACCVEAGGAAHCCAKGAEEGKVCPVTGQTEK